MSWLCYLFVLFSSLLLTVSANARGFIDGGVYGRLNVSLQYEHNAETEGVWKLESNASRLGFYGESTVTESLVALYQVEYGAEVDDGDKGGEVLTQRDTFLGLQGGWGQIKVGRLTIPFKESKGDFDLFNDLQGELGKIIDGEERLSNTLQYASPSILGVVATVAVILREEADSGNALSASFVFRNHQPYLALAVNNNVKRQDQWRAVSRWRWGDVDTGLLNFGLLYQYSKGHEKSFSYVDGEDKAEAFGISSSYALRNNTLKLQYIVSNRSASISGSNQLSLALDHQLSERSVLYGYFTNRQADERLLRNRYLAVGIKHDF